jgi:hypothetical protein
VPTYADTTIPTIGNRISVMHDFNSLRREGLGLIVSGCLRYQIPGELTARAAAFRCSIGFTIQNPKPHKSGAVCYPIGIPNASLQVMLDYAVDNESTWPGLSGFDALCTSAAICF